MVSNEERTIQSTLSVDFVHDIATSASGRRFFVYGERDGMLNVDTIRSDTLKHMAFAAASHEQAAVHLEENFFDGLEE